MIDVKGLYKSFGDHEVLHDLNEHIHPGEKVVIIGPSGSGKSTFLRCLNLLEEPTQGTITFQDQVITDPKADINLIRRQMGMVFQHFNLFPNMTIRKNITLAPVRTGLMKQEEADKTATELLERVGLADKADAYPGQLSGGMAQRVALARSLINEPDILLLDEPLGALDAFTRMNMQDEILSIWREKKQLVIMVTHDVDEAIYMGSKVIVMEPHPGRIRAQIPIEMEYPRNRSSAQFVEYRNSILEMLNYIKTKLKS